MKTALAAVCCLPLASCVVLKHILFLECLTSLIFGLSLKVYAKSVDGRRLRNLQHIEVMKDQCSDTLNLVIFQRLKDLDRIEK